MNKSINNCEHNEVIFESNCKGDIDLTSARFHGLKFTRCDRSILNLVKRNEEEICEASLVTFLMFGKESVRHCWNIEFGILILTLKDQERELMLLEMVL
jgi:hypothetical protein